MKWCLPKFLADPFIEELQKNPQKMVEIIDMIPTERHKYFSKLFGEEHGTKVNASFEKKLLLKNFQLGMENWVKNLPKEQTEVKRDLLTKILKLERVLNPSEEKRFMHDLAAQSLGVDVTYEQAKRIVELAKVAKQKQMARDINNKETYIEYGLAEMELDEYANSIAPKEKTWYGLAMDYVGLPQALQTTMDVSINMRQLWGLMTTKEYWKNFNKQFAYFDENAYRRQMAEIRGDPDFELAKKANLRLTELHGNIMNMEEIGQTSLAEKIPVIGKAIKGFQQMFTARANEVRFAKFKNDIAAAHLEGRDVSIGSALSKDIAQVINDFSGSASLGKGDRLKNIGPLLNLVFYSVRNLKATFNILNPVMYVKLDPFARKIALRQFFGSASIAIGILGFAKLMGAEVETNPSSSEFGKMKFGNTVIDVTGGKASMIVLLARLLSNRTKGIDGEVRKLGGGYGKKTRKDVLEKFLRNKLAPIPSFVMDVFAESDAVGNPVNTPATIGMDAWSRFYPMIAGDTISLLKDEEYGKSAAITLLNVFGNSVQTYEEKKSKTKKKKRTI